MKEEMQRRLAGDHEGIAEAFEGLRDAIEKDHTAKAIFTGLNILEQVVHDLHDVAFYVGRYVELVESDIEREQAAQEAEAAKESGNQPRNFIGRKPPTG